MSRLRAAAAAALVALVAFYYLAAPVLRALFGPAALLPAYAAVALLAGAAVYYLTRHVAAYEPDVDEPGEQPLEELVGPGSAEGADGDAGGGDGADDGSAGDAGGSDGEARDVEEMLRELDGEREG